MKTYEAIFEPHKHRGVYGISLVENPAMEGHFIALKEETQVQLKTVNEDERILIGLVLEPDKPVYRKHDGEEFNLVFAAETIKSLAYNFYKAGFHKNSSLEHANEIDGVTFVESWIIEDSKIDKSVKFGLSYPKGSWMATMKVDSDEVWNDYVKTGKVKGFSIDALISLKEVNKKTTIKMTGKEIADAISKGFEGVIAHFSKTQKVDLGAIKTLDGEVDIQFEGDTMEPGGRVWIIAEDKTEVPLPAGDYQLDDKRILTVSEDGKIGAVKDAPAEAAPAAEQKPAEMTAAETDATAKAIENAIKSIMIKYKSDTDKYKSDTDKEIAKLKAQIVTLSNQPAAKPIRATVVQSEPTNAKQRLLQAIQEA